MGYIADANAHSGTEIVGPLPSGAVDIGSRLKGWATAALIIGAAIFVMKYLGPGRKKRKNPRRARRPSAIERQRQLARQRARAIWSEAMDEEMASGHIRLRGPRLEDAYERARAEERKWKQSRRPLKRKVKARKSKLRRRSSAAKRSLAAKRGWATRRRKARK